MEAAPFLGEDPVEVDVPTIDIEHGHVGNPEFNEAVMAELIEWVVIEIARHVFKWNIPELKYQNALKAVFPVRGLPLFSFRLNSRADPTHHIVGGVPIVIPIHRVIRRIAIDAGEFKTRIRARWSLDHEIGAFTLTDDDERPPRHVVLFLRPKERIDFLRSTIAFPTAWSLIREM